MFLECMDFCREINFSKIHVFPYSRREGTKACEIPNHLDNATKKDRSRRLISVSDELNRDYNSKFINQVVNVLIEEVKDGKSIGHTSNYLRVIIDEELVPNNEYDVVVTELYQESVKAKLHN